jgi:riboflavin kinase/FMN adenylyltransferase
MEQAILRGQVIRGADRGKDLGFPTANLDIPSQALPKTGVYAVWVRIEDEQRWRPGAAHIGFNLTFNEKTKKLEVYLLDFSGELYGKTLEILPVAYLRPEERYRSSAELIRQMRRDCRRAARLLDSSRPP